MQQHQAKRSEAVLNFLKNPYNLQAKSTAFDDSTPTSGKVSQRNTLRKFFQPYRTKIRFNDINGTNSHYLMKTNAFFRETHIQWKQQLQTCLRTQQVTGVPNRSKVAIQPAQAPNFRITRKHSQNRKLQPVLEIQVQKLF